MENVPRQTILAALNYLSTRTRPGIATAVLLSEKFQVDSTAGDWKALKHVLRFLHGTSKLGVFLSLNTNVQLETYSYADCAGGEEGRQSSSGHVIYYADAPIS